MRRKAIFAVVLMLLVVGLGVAPGGAIASPDWEWLPVSNVDAPSARTWHTGVWTGTEMIVWGGYASGSFMNTGGRYNPATDTWTPISTTNAPHRRCHHTAVWTGSEMIVWGGGYQEAGSTYELNTGGRYNPATDTWTPISTTNAPSPRYRHTAVWTGTEMIVWGGWGGGVKNTGGRYNPATDTWTPTSTTNTPSARWTAAAVWTGTEMIVWGGLLSSGGPSTDTGGRYDPATDAWTTTSTTNAPSPRYRHTAVWTGAEMIVWGGRGDASTDTGGRYNLATNTWIATSTIGAPSARQFHVAVWTGSEMIIWGGNYDSYKNTGGRYDPATDTWTPTSTTGAPSARQAAAGVWTGVEMIIWGGCAIGGSVNTGGRYYHVIPTLTHTLASGWNMFSLPLSPEPANWASQLEEISPLNIYRWASSYQMYPDASIPCSSGYGYWVNLDADTEVSIEGAAVPEEDFTIYLAPGWNMIGDPFSYSVDWGDVTVSYAGETASLEQAHVRQWIFKYLYWHDPSDGRYHHAAAPDGQLDPWIGYWVLARAECDLVIPPTPMQ